MTARVHPVILCGGGGTRLWPKSRQSYPKQFSALLDENSLLHNTLDRLSGPDFAAPLLLTREAFRFVVGEHLAQSGIPQGRILIEPEPRNTAPAIAAAALLLSRDDPQALMLVAPSDHLVGQAALTRAIAQAKPAALAGQIVCFGVQPDHPATGYGYIETTGPGVAPIKRFVEKPPLPEAKTMLAAGTYLWNAGLFLFRADTILAALAAHAPAVLKAAQRAVDGSAMDLDFRRLGAEFAKAPDISIDYAVMERAMNCTVVPISGHWNDLGSWQTVWDESPKDPQGVAGDGVAIGCSDTLLSGGDMAVVGIGLHNIAVIATPDAVLVTALDQTQKVGEAVALLRKANAPQADAFQREYRPWGWFETISKAGRYHVKRISVKPGGRLSLQSHEHRSEHWVIVEGVATVTVGQTTKDVLANQSLYVPLGAKHRLENLTDRELTIIETQVGDYLQEDDIIRYDDIYDRR